MQLIIIIFAPNEHTGVRHFIILITVLFSFVKPATAQSLLCGAGNDFTLCPNVSGQLNAAISGGQAPYNYHWEPAGFCTNANSVSTTINITSNTNFTLTVIDASQDTCTDVVAVYVDDIRFFGAGPDQWRCFFLGTNVTIGDADNYQGNYTYSWQPTSDLSDPTAPKPLATPSVTTTFTVSITSPACGTIVDSVTVKVNVINADAGPAITIDEGQTVTMQGSGGAIYYWAPEGIVKYGNTANPDVNPVTTTTFTMVAIDEYGCEGYDTVTVFVRPYDGLFFYNTFSPNNDGSNDTWMIGNIHKYPENKLEIFNRYGQLIYKRFGYMGEWNGTYLGEELPSGTYYYYLDTGDGKDVYKGSVTIIR